MTTMAGDHARAALESRFTRLRRLQRIGAFNHGFQGLNLPLAQRLHRRAQIHTELHNSAKITATSRWPDEHGTHKTSLTQNKTPPCRIILSGADRLVAAA